MITIRDTIFSVFFYLLENNPSKESWRSLKPNTNILTTVLQNSHDKRLPILIVLELCVLKTFDIVQSAEFFDFFDIFRFFRVFQVFFRVYPGFSQLLAFKGRLSPGEQLLANKLDSAASSTFSN